MDDFEKQIHAMFDHIWDCEIDHPVFQDTVGELMGAVIQCYKSLPSAQPETEERTAESAQNVPNGELISKKAAIDAINKALSRVFTEPCGEQILKDLPSAQPEQRWIPCSERLPEDEQNVLVTYKTTDKIHPCQYHDDGSRNPWYSYIDQCRAHMNVVLAWMPLPEPYMRGEQDEQTD